MLQTLRSKLRVFFVFEVLARLHRNDLFWVAPGMPAKFHRLAHDYRIARLRHEQKFIEDFTRDFERLAADDEAAMRGQERATRSAPPRPNQRYLN